MQGEQDKLLLDIERLQQENNLLKSKMDKMLQGEADARLRVVEATRQAEDIKKAAQLEYSLTLKALLNFNEKFARVTSENGDKTAEVVGVISGYLKEIGKTSSKEIVERIEDTLFTKAEIVDNDGEISFEFDLEEAINPKKDLDLKTLCEELGVYRG